jgi:hypothetical protein
MSKVKFRRITGYDASIHPAAEKRSSRKLEAKEKGRSFYAPTL